MFGSVDCYDSKSQICVNEYEDTMTDEVLD